jgi:predicted MFS family arabinose efflux permease
MRESPLVEARPARQVVLGLRENRVQFSLLVLVNAFVGTMVGVERSVLPLLAEEEYGVGTATAALSFLIAFGLTKAFANFVAGDFAHRIGRRRILLIGWLFAIPVPLLLWWAPSWGWVVFANLLLGINQGLAWSATVIMKIDLVGPKKRGLAMGLNEFAGYLAVAVAALGAGYMAAAYGPRSGPVWIGGAAALLGLVVTLLFVRDTGAHVELEHAMADQALEGGPDELPAGLRARLWHASWGRRPLFAANQAGLVNNLNDGLAWGLFPLFFAAAGLSVREIGWLAALYPAVWGIAQISTGALSDRTGRRPLIVSGMLLQAVGLGIFAVATGFGAWAFAAVLLGLGTAAVYPTLIAQVSDLVTPRDRASSVGVYRLWRDLGYVAGGLLAGLLADLLGYRVAIGVVAGLTALSGLAAWRYLPPPPSRADDPTGAADETVPAGDGLLAS